MQQVAAAQVIRPLPRSTHTGLEPAILDWYGHCGVNKLGGSGGYSPKKNFKIRPTEITSESMFGQKCH